MGQKEIFISIFCITYNHVKYIRDALEGFLMQETEYNYEIVIYDDASTDGTSDILREYERKYPNVIRTFISDRNIWRDSDRQEKLLAFQQKNLRGEYIALCEGDDFWIDKHKLQIQVSYLIAHSECAMYMHNNLQISYKDGEIKVSNPFNGAADEKNVSAQEIIMQYNGHPPTASFVFRREILYSPQFYSFSPVGDYPLQLYALTCGEIHYSNRIMSVYRYMTEGSYSSSLGKEKYFSFRYAIGLIDFLILYNKKTEFVYHKWCHNQLQMFSSYAIAQFDVNDDIEDFMGKCIEAGFWIEERCKNYIVGLRRLLKATKDEFYISESLADFLQKHNHIVIMGAGKYAAIVTRQLANNGVNFEGYAVSRTLDGDEQYLGKKVWKLSDIPYDKCDVGVVVGINPLHWDEIEDDLKNAGIIYYHCPFLFSE